MKDYDVILIGAGASGIFAAYEFTKRQSALRILVLDEGREIAKRNCPMKTGAPSCVDCKPCNIMNGFGGAGTLSDGKYNITTEFGGEMHDYVGREEAIQLMEYVDEVLCGYADGTSRLYSTDDSDLKTVALRHDLHLLRAKVRHFGTERNYKNLERLYEDVKDAVEFRFLTKVANVEREGEGFAVTTSAGEVFTAKKVVLATGRSGSKWTSDICDAFEIPTMRNRVDIGVRVELPAEIFAHITDEVYEAKLVYQTEKYNDLVRTFCMNPHGEVVTENTNGILTVNGHSYADPAMHTENTNFALLVTNRMTEPFKDSNEYGESIARLSNMLGGGVLLQRFGDLMKGRRSSERRMRKCFTRPTLNATPGDLSLVIPKRQLDDIIETLLAFEAIAPGTANDDTLLYGVEVKFYNSKVDVDENFETPVRGLYAVGDGSGVTHSLSQASACGVAIARHLMEIMEG